MRALSIAVGLEGRFLSPVRRMAVPGALVAVFRWLRAHLTDEWCIALLAAALSIGSYAWYDAHGLTSAFNDARIREMIGRRVVAGRTPGLAQLGAIWLPLTSLFMLPLIWNDRLFQSGIASSVPSMLAFVIAAVYLYRIGRLVTSSRGAGWVAAGVLMLNPSILYMQSTAMSETLSLSAFVVSIYYALRLVRTNSAADIVKCAAAIAAGTLIRYENWLLAIALLPIIAYAGWRHRGRMLAEAWTILYGLLAFAGCAAWVVYNAVIFHDPLLSFFYGQTSHSVYANASDSLLPARHHAWTALETYGLTVIGTIGWVLAATALLGFIVFVVRERLRVALLPVYLTLVPLGFYWLILFGGFNTVNMPELGTGSYYNIRFGVMIIPAVALFLAFLTTASRTYVKRALIAGAVAVIAFTSVVGSMQTPFVLREALYGAGSDEPARAQTEAQWLSSHYHGGNVLITYVNSPTILFYLLTEHHFADDAFITDANGSQFIAALDHPEAGVRWIIMSSDSRNGESRIWATLHNRADWRQYFALRKTFGDTEVYERATVAPSPVANSR